MTDSVAGIYVSQDIKRIKIETREMSLDGKTIIDQITQDRRSNRISDVE